MKVPKRKECVKESRIDILGYKENNNRLHSFYTPCNIWGIYE